MKKIARILILLIAIFIISLFLFVTGKRHIVFIENNSYAEIKYSINGEPYKSLGKDKKAKLTVKGINNTIFLKTLDDKVVEKKLKLGKSKDINLFVNESLTNNSNWFEEIEIN